MKMTFVAMAFSVMMAGSAAFALTPDQVISDLQAQGYTRVEVRVGPTQMKVEAIKGTEKVEIIYDSATGTVLKTETEAVRPGENTAPGVSVRERGRDFVRVERRDSSDDDSDDDSNDDHGGRGSDDNDDDGDDDHGGHGRGGDDSSDDDSDDDNDDSDDSNDDDDSDDDSDDDNSGSDD